MKFYNNNLSPYAARCRIQMYAKELAIDIINVKSGYADINPVGKIPVLHIGQQIIPESETIMEYFEDKFPEPSLRPDTPELCAQTRAISRLADLYVMSPLTRLFSQLQPASRDENVVQSAYKDILGGLTKLEFFLDGKQYAVANKLTLADCTLVPTLLYVSTMLPFLGLPVPFDKFPKLKSYVSTMRNNPSVAKVLSEVEAAFGTV